MILGLHHAAIAVPDIEAALRFYGDVVGFEVVNEVTLPGGIASLARAFGLENAGCKVRMLRKGNSFIELFEFDETLQTESDRPVNRIGITHIALASDDAEADYARLEAAGVVFNAALFGAAPSRFAYGRDPFGNVIELLEHDPEGDSGRRFD
jgi:glyoxylase I family protein